MSYIPTKLDLRIPYEAYLTSGSVIVAPELNDPNILRAAMRVKPSLRLLAPFNRALPLELWFELYTHRPKVALPQALALASRSLEGSQIEHMRREKRSSVWSAVRLFNQLDRSLLSDLGRQGCYDSRYQFSYGDLTDKVLARTRPSPFTFKKDFAEGVSVSKAFDMSSIGPAVNFLRENISSLTAWENFFVLCDSFEGTLTSLVESCNALG